MEQEALDRLARVSKMALDAGVAERAVRIAEATGSGSRRRSTRPQPLGLAPAARAELAERFRSALAGVRETADDDLIAAPT